MMNMVVVLSPSIELLAQSLRCERLSAGSLKIPLLNGGAMSIGFISFLLLLNKSNYKANLHKFQRIKNIITPPNIHSDKNLSLFSTLKDLHFIHHLLEWTWCTEHVGERKHSEPKASKNSGNKVVLKPIDSWSNTEVRTSITSLIQKNSKAVGVKEKPSQLVIQFKDKLSNSYDIVKSYRKTEGNHKHQTKHFLNGKMIGIAFVWKFQC